MVVGHELLLVKEGARYVVQGPEFAESGQKNADPGKNVPANSVGYKRTEIPRSGSMSLPMR